MEQVVDLQEDKEFQSLDIEVLSISPDPIKAWETEARNLNIQTPLLSDSNNKVAKSYGVMQWAVGNEPGHTFVLIDRSGQVAWLRDYGAPENGGFMYVLPSHLSEQVKQHLADAA
jgi:peroxiredoxin